MHLLRQRAQQKTTSKNEYLEYFYRAFHAHVMKKPSHKLSRKDGCVSMDDISLIKRMPACTIQLNTGKAYTERFIET